MTDRVWRMVIVLLLAVALLFHFFPLYAGIETFSFFALTVIQLTLCLLAGSRVLGWRDILAFLAAGILLGWGAEALSLATTFPFGGYRYTPVLGWGMGPVPLVIPFAWFVVAYMGYTAAGLIVDHAPGMGGGPLRVLGRALLAGLFVGLFDLGLDPFMTDRKVNAWKMLKRGPYFGETEQGYLGWVLVGFAIALVFELLRKAAGGGPRPVAEPRWVVAVPVILFAAWGLFLVLFGHPPETQLVALFGLGSAVVAATMGLLDWKQVTPVRE